MWETWVHDLGWEDPLEKGKATHSRILAWRVLWAEEPGGLESMGSQRLGHDWVIKTTNVILFLNIICVSDLSFLKIYWHWLENNHFTTLWWPLPTSAWVAHRCTCDPCILNLSPPSPLSCHPGGALGALLHQTHPGHLLCNVPRVFLKKRQTSVLHGMAR